MATRTYDLTILIDADAPSETRSQILSSTEEMIKATGEVTEAKDWGTRQTTFEIDHHTEAEYHVWRFDAEPETLEKLDRSLKIMEGVLRFRVIKAVGDSVPDAPPPPKRPTDERATYERPPRNARADAVTEESAQVAAAAAPGSTVEPPAEATAPDAPAAPAEEPAAAGAPAEDSAEPAAEQAAE